MPENQRAAQRAHENAHRPAEDYDGEGRPAAARARDHIVDAPKPADPDTERDEPDRPRRGGRPTDGR
ncbi:hypothetical protein GCM10023200_36370 [Actinomycetospora chlora]|uniref:Uncharacterized protein n=1 Tax=Actinomycetospora chlora TaxID=663608 RepID=A0ABP9BPE9_9PSEU